MIFVTLIMMKLLIGRCSQCKKIRLVDRSKGNNVCFACKQKRKKKV
ncbi:MAG: hypothetical protein QT00_C0001G0487 [archaeon GW2011_AR5]|nr:MAG: hypothetical protein QT00_C0001G0487 [archaeon GW2011_AR5]